MSKFIESGWLGDLASALLLLLVVAPLIARWQWAMARAGKEGDEC